MGKSQPLSARPRLDPSLDLDGRAVAICRDDRVEHLQHAPPIGSRDSRRPLFADGAGELLQFCASIAVTWSLVMKGLITVGCEYAAFTVLVTSISNSSQCHPRSVTLPALPTTSTVKKNVDAA